MKEEIKQALSNIGKALAHPDFKLSQGEHFQLANDFSVISKALTPVPEKDEKDTK